MEAIAFTAIVIAAATANKKTDDGKEYADNFTLYGRPWIRNTNPNLNINKKANPKNNDLYGNEASLRHLPIKQLQENNIAQRLRKTPFSSNQRNNHFITKNYNYPSLRQTFGNGESGMSQHFGFGKHDNGMKVKRMAQNPVGCRHRNLHLRPRGMFPNNPDLKIGPVYADQHDRR